MRHIPDDLYRSFQQYFQAPFKPMSWEDDASGNSFLLVEDPGGAIAPLMIAFDEVSGEVTAASWQTENGGTAEAWFASGGVAELARVTNDDGSQVETVFDADNAATWFSQEVSFNSDGAIVSESTTLDNGTEVTHAADPLSDPTDPASWQTTVTPAPVDEQPVLVHPEPQIISGYQVGQAFGSALGQLIGGSNTFARVAAGSALGVVLGNVGETLQIYFNDTWVSGSAPLQNVTLAQAAELSFANFGAELASGFASAGLGAASAYLTAEFAESLGINSNGIGGQLYNLTGMARSVPTSCPGHRCLLRPPAEARVAAHGLNPRAATRPPDDPDDHTKHDRVCAHRRDDRGFGLALGGAQRERPRARHSPASAIGIRGARAGGP
jgi:hypothetical protein